MNANEREQVRLSLLRYLDANAGKRFPLSEPVLLQFVRSEGMELGATELRAELVYLRDKGLVRPAAKAISPEIGAWEITAEGRDFYARF